MSIHWRRITAHVWQLDPVWAVVEETPGQWRAYRGNQALLADFRTVEEAMMEAERLKKEDAMYQQATEQAPDPFGMGGTE